MANPRRNCGRRRRPIPARILWMTATRPFFCFSSIGIGLYMRPTHPRVPLARLDHERPHAPMMTPKIARFLAEQNPPTPCLVVDLDVIAHNFKRLRKAMPL